MKQASLLRTTLTLLIVCAVAGLLVAGVNALTEERIQKRADAVFNETVASFFPEASTTTATPLSVKGLSALYRYDSPEGETLAWAAVAEPRGFADAIRLCIVTDHEGVLLGIKVLAASETPGLGDKTCRDEYLASYRGLQYPVAFGDGPDAITGATVSSNAILNAVNETLAILASLGGAA